MARRATPKPTITTAAGDRSASTTTGAKRRSSTRSAGRTVGALRSDASARDLFKLRDEVARATAVLGNGGVAHVVGVSKSQPSRWRTGAEEPSPASAERIVDLDHVLAQLARLWSDERLMNDWLMSHNAHLGATPADVLRLRGAAPVLEAIRAEAAGAFA